MSGLQAHSLNGTPGCAGLRPACLQVSPLNLISKQLCSGDMRTGGPRTQPTHPANAPSQRTQPVPRGSHVPQLRIFQWRTHFGSRALWVRGPAARLVSSFTAQFNLKAALRRGHADRRSAHPANAPSHAPSPCLGEATYRSSEFFKGERILEVGPPGCAGLRPAWFQVSPLSLISKQLCARDMRTGGPRTQPTHPARASGKSRTAAQNSRHSGLGARAIAL